MMHAPFLLTTHWRAAERAASEQPVERRARGCAGGAPAAAEWAVLLLTVDVRDRRMILGCLLVVATTHMHDG